MSTRSITDDLPVAANPHAERLASLFDAHYDRLYRLARRLVSTRDDALDLVQETFLRAARSPMKVPVGKRNEEAWLVRVLINVRRDQWRRAAIRDRYRNAVDVVAQPSDPESALIARTMVWQALDLLGPRRRAIVVMHELEAIPEPAIASLLGLSTITVRWHLSLGRRDLARALKSFMGNTNEDN